jgi:hypothetical protein
MESNEKEFELAYDAHNFRVSATKARITVGFLSKKATTRSAWEACLKVMFNFEQILLLSAKCERYWRSPSGSIMNCFRLLTASEVGGFVIFSLSAL